jgi:hypothetical protein
LFVTRRFRASRALIQQGDINRQAGCKKRDKTKKRASPKKQRKTKRKQRTEAEEGEGLLLNRQKAWTCGLA